MKKPNHAYSVVETELGVRLRRERTSRGLSLRALADQTNVSASLLSQIERGQSRPSVSTLMAIVTAQNLSLDELFAADTGEEEASTDPPPESSGNGHVTSTRAVPPVANELPPGDSFDLVASGLVSIQRADSRLRLVLDSGVQWERLTACAVPGTEFMLVSYEPGSSSSRDGMATRHAGIEFGLLQEGELHVTTGFDEHVLRAGDAITLDSTIPHRLENRGAVRAVGVWFILGRHFGNGVS